MVKLQIKRSTHGDQFFAVDKNMVIYKVFYSVDKCEDYVYEHNNRIKL